MLIISMPKAASTSLKTTLCLAHGFEAVPEGLWDLPISSEFHCFSRLWPAHMRELDQKTVQMLISPRRLARFHILPTRNNQELLNRHKKVIVLRSPVDVICSLRRSVKKGLHKSTPIDFEYCKGSEEAWIKRARDIGLLDDMNNFIDEWCKHGGDKLIIQYKELSSDPHATIERVERYFGLELSGTRSLRKDNFARSRLHAIRYKLLTHPSISDIPFIKKRGL